MFDRFRSTQLRSDAVARESRGDFLACGPPESDPFPRFACAVAADLRAGGIDSRGSNCGGFVSGDIVIFGGCVDLCADC